MGYGDKIMLTGSCFTEHIGQALADVKMDVLQNPNGILFNPESICRTLTSYIENSSINEQSLFGRDECWHHWQYHSRFSGTDPAETLRQMNQSQQLAHIRILNADWLVITLGSAFSYRLTGDALSAGAAAGLQAGDGVANCHRAPAAWFQKELLSIEKIITLFDNCLHRIWYENPDIRVLFTVSPVRHAREGLVENNRSKARLIEAVHHLVGKFDRLYYFPAYELVIDVLRDYRFFDIDLVHPNYAATQFVLEKFIENCIRPGDHGLLQELKKLSIAKRHKAFQPDTNAHKKFLKAQLDKAVSLQEQYPYLNLSEEIQYFRSGI